MEKIVFVGGWTRDKKSYAKFFRHTITEDVIYFFPCFEALSKSGECDNSSNLKRFFDKHEIDRATLVGHSLGGVIATEFALKYPERVSSLYLIDSAGVSVRDSAINKIWKALKAQQQFWRLKFKENFSTTFRFFSRPGKNIRSLSLAYNCSLEEVFPKLLVKTTIIWGEFDHIYPLATAEKIHRLIPNSRLCIIKDMDHDWIIHSPEHFWGIVKPEHNIL